MPLTVDRLLAGPRGRRFCLELVNGDGRVGYEAPETTRLYRSLSWASYHLATAAGRGGTLFGPGASGPHPRPTRDEVAEALAAAPLPDLDDTAVLLAMARSVDAAMYWQEPDGDDLVLAWPELREPLERVAAHVLASPPAAWLDAPFDPVQWEVEFTDSDFPRPDVIPSAAEQHVEWQTEALDSERSSARYLAKHPTVDVGGLWWSTPSGLLTQSSAAIGDAGPLGSWFVEDSFGWSEVTAFRLDVPPSARVFEVDGPEAWAELCRRYPLDVTAGKGSSWRQTTGRRGRWTMPDWRLASADIDAIHVTVGAYLEAATTAIPVDGEVASVMAHWAPGRVQWLTDVRPAAAPAVAWSRDAETDVWVRTDRDLD